MNEYEYLFIKFLKNGIQDMIVDCFSVTRLKYGINVSRFRVSGRVHVFRISKFVIYENYFYEF